MLYDGGKILVGLGTFLGIVTAPAWYGLGHRGAPPELEKPANAKECIEPIPVMRARHMELLDAWRNAVVRDDQHVYVATTGLSHPISLTGTCLRCHADPAKFCDRCHAYAGVDAYCWDCHQKKRRAAP